MEEEKVSPDASESAEGDGDASNATESKSDGKTWPREPLSLSNFLVVLCAILTLIIGALAPVYLRLNIWTVALVTLAVLLALTMAFTKLPNAGWFRASQSWLLVAALLVGGIYVTASKSNRKAPEHHPKQHKITHVVAPKIEVAVPPSPRPGSVPKVKCPQTVSGTVTGIIPRDEVLVVGYRPSDISIWTFSVQAPIHNGHWSAKVSIGQKPDAGKLFAVVYFLVQSRWANYLVNSFAIAALGDTWWDARSLPPFTKSSVYQTVQRTTPDHGSC